jgi:TfoX/Sxy family transcriptional regulator of competence genes
VPYDEDLVVRVRELIGDADGVSEKRMFGGLAFLIHGNMAVAASGKGGLMLRVEPDETEQIVDETEATPMIMRGGPVHGWVRVASDKLGGKEALEGWVERGVAYARSLPAK